VKNEKSQRNNKMIKETGKYKLLQNIVLPDGRQFRKGCIFEVNRIGNIIDPHLFYSKTFRSHHNVCVDAEKLITSDDIEAFC